MTHLLTLLLATAPAQDTGDWSGIVNGDEENRFPAAVSIGAGGDRFRFSACSASLITPRLLLTAAHCTAEFGIPVEQVASFGVAFFGADIYDDVPIVGYDEVLNHPRYLSISGFGTPENDIGVIVLAEDAPVEPILFNMDELGDDDIDKTLTSVGYGITSAATQAGSGLKRSAKLTIDELDGQFIVSNSFTNDNDANVCSGDSGGPQYRKLPSGRWEQWSVHSWADQNCVFTSGSTRTDLFTTFLMNQVEKVHGTGDLCEAAGFYGNGTCDDYCDADPDCFEDEGGAKACGCDASGPSGGGLAFLVSLLALGLRRRR